MAYKVIIVSNSSSLVDRLGLALNEAEDEFSYLLQSTSDDIIDSVSHFSPDVILFDAAFEGQGADLISFLKSDPRTGTISLISVVDFDNTEEVQAVFNAGAESIVGINFTPQELIQRMMIVIQKGMTLNRLRYNTNHLNDLTSAISCAGNSVLIIDKNGDISWVNEGFKRVYESSLEEVKKAIGGSVFSKSDNNEMRNVMRNAMHSCRESGEYVTYENTWITPSGKKKFIQTSLTPIYDESGIFNHIIAIESDVTELKRIECALEEKNIDLQKMNVMLAEQRAEILEQAKLLEIEKSRSEELLKNILPWEVARSLQKKGVYKPKQFKEVSVLFTDFVGFSKLSANYEKTEELLEVLNHYFESFDEIVSHHFVEKIKTMGDGYICAGGLPRTNRSHAFDTVLAALEILNMVMQQEAKDIKDNRPIWSIRIGIHTGSVIAGVIGKNKLGYDIWGDTVNTASRMETAGERGRINISETTYNYIKDYFCCVSRGKIPAKNIGDIEMYFVDRIKPEFSDDEYGIVPNATFRKILSSF